MMSARQMNVRYIYITYFRVTEIDVVMYLLMIPPPLQLYIQLQLRLLVCRKKKEIIFFQDIGESTNFDLKLTKDGISPKLLWQCLSKRIQEKQFFITSGCLVSADQPIINYKRRLRRKLTKTPDFSQILICRSIDRSMYMQLYSFVRR